LYRAKAEKKTQRSGKTEIAHQKGGNRKSARNLAWKGEETPRKKQKQEKRWEKKPVETENGAEFA